MESFIPSSAYDRLPAAPSLASDFYKVRDRPNHPAERIYAALRYRELRCDEGTPEDPRLDPRHIFNRHPPRFAHLFGRLIPVYQDKSAPDPVDFHCMNGVYVTGHRADPVRGFDILTLRINGKTIGADGRPYHMVLSASDELMRNYTAAQIQTEIYQTGDNARMIDISPRNSPGATEQIFADRVYVRETNGDLTSILLHPPSDPRDLYIHQAMG